MGPLMKRILVALAAIPLLLGLTFWSWTPPFTMAVLAALGWCLREYAKLAEGTSWKFLPWPGALSLLLLLAPKAFPALPLDWLQDPFVWVIFLLTLSFLWDRRPIPEMVPSVAFTLLGVAYFGVLGRYFLVLRGLPQGSWHLLWLYAATWAYDTGGFFGGRWFGKRFFAPQVSPKKTVEGCVGGAIMVLFTLGLLNYGLGGLSDIPRYGPFELLGLCVLLSFFAQLGDLVESMIKRSLNAKDSGDLLPGHGGVFDRVDSLLFNAPVMYLFLSWTHHI